MEEHVHYVWHRVIRRRTPHHRMVFNHGVGRHVTVWR
jgi:hypothetical protein